MMQFSVAFPGYAAFGRFGGQARLSELGFKLRARPLDA
jgi:hypothetical protein